MQLGAMIGYCRFKFRSECSWSQGTYYDKYIHVGWKDTNGILMSFLLLVAETKIIQMPIFNFKLISKVRNDKDIMTRRLKISLSFVIFYPKQN